MNAPEASGKTPIRALLHLARNKVWRVILPGCFARGELAPSTNRAAIGVHETSPEKLAAGERKFLLELARAAVVRAANSSDLPASEVEAVDVPVKLTAPGACFVTLTRNAALRGCIGQIVRLEPLYLAVAHNAENAATRDPRFSPVQPEEVAEIRIEISVLTEPQPLSFSSPEELLDKLQPSRDGVVLKIGLRGATFLPQVWGQFSDKVEFLNQLSRKAGCTPLEWRGHDTSISIYRVEAFGEAV